LPASVPTGYQLSSAEIQISVACC